MTEVAIADLVMAMSCLPRATDAPGTKIYTRFLVAALRSLNPTDEELAELTRRASLRFKFRPVPAELAELLREIRAEKPEPVWYETVEAEAPIEPANVDGDAPAVRRVVAPTVRILRGDEAVAARKAFERAQAAQALPNPDDVATARAAYQARLRELFGMEGIA